MLKVTSTDLTLVDFAQPPSIRITQIGSSSCWQPRRFRCPRESEEKDSPRSRGTSSPNYGSFRNAQSLNHLFRPHDERLRDGQAKRLRCLQIDDELESRWLFDRQVGWLCALENPVYVPGGHDIVFDKKRAIGDQTAVPGHIRGTVD